MSPTQSVVVPRKFLFLYKTVDHELKLCISFNHKEIIINLRSDDTYNIFINIMSLCLYYRDDHDRKRDREDRDRERKDRKR